MNDFYCYTIKLYNSLLNSIIFVEISLPNNSVTDFAWFRIIGCLW